MKIDFVVPRYGDEIVGGAEFAVRRLAEHLAMRSNFDVGVLSTCAVDARTWADALPAGTGEERGVRVSRFSAIGRSPDFDKQSGPLLAAPERMTDEEQAHWLRLQGPVSDGLGDAVRTSDADAVVLSPYLFHPTVTGVRDVGDRAVLHGAAHDEAVLRIPMYRSVFGGAGALVFYTHAEQRLVQSRFPIAATPQIVLGLGVDDPPSAAPDDDPVGLGGRPYLLCLGRVEGAKGTGELARAFAAYKQRRRGELQLVFVGPIADRPPAHADIHVLGAVDEATKWAALRGALALVSPSRHESFGLVLFEAWLSGTPVVVHRACAATREHCERSGGGLWYGDVAELVATLDRLAASPGLRAELAAAGARYTRTHCAWPLVVDRYAAFLESVVARSRPSELG